MSENLDETRLAQRLLARLCKDTRLDVLGQRPLVAQTPESLLDDDTTPTALMFIRNNGRLPPPAADPQNWRITVDGEVENPLTLTLSELQRDFEHVTRRMVIECGGNGRSFFVPPVRGNRWTNGGAACPLWAGVRLADVLRRARVKPSAVFSGHYGADPSTKNDGKPALSRGVPIAKLRDENNLIAWAVNGEPLPQAHGFPVRLIIPGWPGSVSAKWLTRVWIRDRYHDGLGMGGIFYRVPAEPVLPGEYDRAKLKDLESMPVRAIITRPADAAHVESGSLALRGASWAGDYKVAKVEVSTDRGATWKAVQLAAPINPYDWQRWTATIETPQTGSLQIWARATDERGVTQPIEPDNWNPHGCGGNPVHRITVKVGD